MHVNIIFSNYLVFESRYFTVVSRNPEKGGGGGGVVIA